VLGGSGFLDGLHFFAIEADIDIVVIAVFLAVAAPVAARRIGGRGLGFDVGLAGGFTAVVDGKVRFGWRVAFEIRRDDAGGIGLLDRKSVG
jgi:hypothetical protein